MDGLHSLTPQNTHIFLYRAAEYQSRFLIVGPTWKVYLRDGDLIYRREGYCNFDERPLFFLHVYPKDVNDLPTGRRQYGYANLDFDPNSSLVLADLLENPRLCEVKRSLPNYDIARILTGQYIPGEGRLWEGGASLPAISPDEMSRFSSTQPSASLVRPGPS